MFEGKASFIGIKHEMWSSTSSTPETKRKLLCWLVSAQLAMLFPNGHLSEKEPYHAANQPGGSGIHIVSQTVGGWTRSFLENGFIAISLHLHGFLWIGTHPTTTWSSYVKHPSREYLCSACRPIPHTCQPLDVTAFHCLKMYWDEECDMFMSTNPGKIVTVYQFSFLFTAARIIAMTPKTITSGFKASGIVRNAIKILEKYRPTQAFPQLC